MIFIFVLILNTAFIPGCYVNAIQEQNCSDLIASHVIHTILCIRIVAVLVSMSSFLLLGSGIENEILEATASTEKSSDCQIIL